MQCRCTYLLRKGEWCMQRLILGKITINQLMFYLALFLTYVKMYHLNMTFILGWGGQNSMNICGKQCNIPAQIWHLLSLLLDPDCVNLNLRPFGDFGDGKYIATDWQPTWEAFTHLPKCVLGYTVYYIAKSMCRRKVKVCGQGVGLPTFGPIQ